jgi:plastocyanin
VPSMKPICTLFAAGAVALLATSPAAPMSPPRLVGTVGPGFTISLKQNGKVVKTLKHGRYTFAISDKSTIHNFEVEGPGVDREITTVPFKGTKTVTILVRKGSYKFYCAPHESSMFGRFKVT